MPSLGADMQFGTIVDWRVKPGDMVKRGDVVALVETEKGVIEVEIFESGVIESLVVQPGQKVPVGTTLATLNGGGKNRGENSGKARFRRSSRTKAADTRELATKISATVSAQQTTRLRVSPLARKRAEQLGIELSSVTGSGEAGSITIADVEQAAESVKAAAPDCFKVGRRGEGFRS